MTRIVLANIPTITSVAVMRSHLSILSGSKLSRRSSSQKEMYPIFFWRSYPKVVENEIPKRVQKRVQKPIQFCEKCDPKTDPITDPKKKQKRFPFQNFWISFWISFWIDVFRNVLGSLFRSFFAQSVGQQFHQVLDVFLHPFYKILDLAARAI